MIPTLSPCSISKLISFNARNSSLVTPVFAFQPGKENIFFAICAITSRTCPVFFGIYPVFRESGIAFFAFVGNGVAFPEIVPK